MRALWLRAADSQIPLPRTQAEVGNGRAQPWQVKVGRDTGAAQHRAMLPLQTAAVSAAQAPPFPSLLK